MVANLAYTATISRLLAPAAFGLMAVANLVVLFVQFFARMGLASALVQKPDLSEEEIRAASTAGIAVGLACLVWCGSSPRPSPPCSGHRASRRSCGSERVVRVHGLVHDGTGPAAPRAPLPHAVDHLGGHIRASATSSWAWAWPCWGRRLEPGGGVGGAPAAPGDLAVRPPPASAPARAPLGAVPGGLRLRGAPVRRPPAGLRRAATSTPSSSPVSRAPRCSASTAGRTTWSSSRSPTTWRRR